MNRWKYITKTDYATVYVDYGHRMTKMETLKYTYYHNGIYPVHNPEYTKRLRKR